ncbi:hypothetical protein E2320_001150 [Naja naja]|nr:hypothetical protein E2320_001150 [Naja naja]
MASRRSLRTRSSLPQQPEEEPQRRRRSLRLARGKTAPFSYQRSLAYQAPANSAQLDVVTPRTVFKKVLQTQPIVSPLVSEKPDSPKPVDTSFNFPVKLDSSSSGFAGQHIFVKKGLIRRPKSYHGINLKDFEGGLEQDLLQIKDSAENNPEDQKTTTLQSNNTEALSTETELFLPPHSREENETEPSNVLPEPDLARQSLGHRSVPPLSQTQLARQDEICGMEVERVAESSPPQILMPGTESTVEAETESMEKEESYQEKCQASSQVGGKESRPSLGKERLSPGPEDAGSIESISQKRIATPQRQQGTHVHGSSSDEELFIPTEPLKTGLGARRSSTPIDAELPRASQRYFSTWLSRKIVRPSMNEMVAYITKELDNIIPEFAEKGLGSRRSSTPIDAELPRASQRYFSTWLSRKIVRPSMNEMVAYITKELDNIIPEFAEKAVNISQSPRVATPNRRASGKTPRMPERIPFKAVKDRTNPQTGDRNRTKEMRTVETEQILEFEAEDNTEGEELSESEVIAVDISQSPRVATRSRRASGKTPKTLERIPFKAMRDRTNPQTAVEISQNPRVATPSRRASGKTPKTLERIPFKAMRDRTNPQTAVDIYQSPRVATPNRCASGKTPKTLERTPLKAMRDRTNPQTAVDISQSPRVATRSRRASGKTPKTLERIPFKAMRDRTNPQTAVEISQNPRVATPSRRASGKTPKTLERIPFKAMRDRTNPQTAVDISQSPRVATRSRRASGKTPKTLERIPFKAMRDRTNPQTAVEISQNPRVATPSRRTSGKTPRTLERIPFKAVRDRTNPQTAKKARREKQEPSLPSTLVKKMFTHYVKMPVTKEALQVVDRCVNVYFKHLSNDLEAYTNHARRKTAEPADLELLMRRQGLITDKMPLTLAFGVQEAANPYRHKWEQSDPSEAEVRSRTAWMPETEHFTFGNKPWRKMIS